MGEVEERKFTTPHEIKCSVVNKIITYKYKIKNVITIIKTQTLSSLTAFSFYVASPSFAVSAHIL
jgi:hypothetical protein